MKVRDALNAAVRQAVKDGKLNRKMHGATIEAARKVATVMDDPDWPIVRGKIDNVSPAVFLKYCEALGLTIGKEAKQPKSAKVDSDKVISVVGNSKWKKRA